MDNPTPCRGQPSPAQIHYANLLFSGSWYALFVMLITYLIYISGAVRAYIPLQEMPHYWTLPVREYLTKAQAPSGWNWLSLAGHGDFLNLSTIAFLLGLSLLCPLALLFASLRQGDRTLAVVLALQLGLLGLAATGLLTPGVH